MAIKMFAAIDVGSFELEMGIYEISQSFGIREVDHLRHVLALGKDTYNDGKIGYGLVKEMCQVLKNFTEIMKSYRITEYRAYATSAMREAKNSQIVLDQIQVRTGLIVKSINNSELRLMSYKAVASKDAAFQKTVQKGTAIIDVGFGSTQISLFDKDMLVSTQNIFLGGLRMREMISRWNLSAGEVVPVMEELVDNELYPFKRIYLKEREIKCLIATGESILFMAKRGIRHMESDRVSAEQFRSFYNRLLSMRPEEIEDYYGVDREYASILVPSAIIYGRVLEMTGAETVWIPGVSLCDGIAAEYAQEKKLVKLRHDFNGDILSAARNMAKRYKCHGAHIQEVDRMASELFDVTKKYHGLGERERLLLRIAAILHDCGKFISSSRETQSSYQIIMATEIIGISHLEREIVANVVRYCNQEFAYNGVHLESDLSQYEGRGLTKRAVTILIAKLTAILRLANALDKSQRQKLAGASLAVKDGKLLITATCQETIILERASFDNTAEFFEEIFGIQPVLKHKRRV